MPIPADDHPPQRPTRTATQIEPQPDYDLHYIICRIHPDDIDKIADAVTARLTP